MELRILDFGTVKAVATNLTRGGEAAVDMTNVMAAILLNMMEIEKTVFSSQGRRGGGSWKQLKPDTIKRKGNTVILRETDALYKSVTEVGAPYQILEMSRDRIEFGTDRPWADVAQYGSVKSPARPFLRFTPNDINRWNSLIVNHLMRSFGGATRGT